MATFTLSNGAKSAMAAALIAHLDADTNPAYARLYTGANPNNPATAVTTQTLLGTVTMSADPSATQSNGLITFNAIAQDDAADASGTATWMRIFLGDGTPWADLDVGDLASSATAKLNTTTVVAGGPIRVNAFTIQVG